MKSNMNIRTKILLGTLAGGLCLTTGRADERRFTYTYEPEVLPKGALEFEQWVTLRSQRTSAGEVGKENFNRWEIREELEYGVTDRYSVSLYLNGKNDSYRDKTVFPFADKSEFEFQGVSIENRYMVLNPADHAIGLTLYLEPRFSGDEAELDRHGEPRLGRGRRVPLERHEAADHGRGKPRHHAEEHGGGEDSEL